MTELPPAKAERLYWWYYAAEGWRNGRTSGGWWHCAKRRHQIVYSTARALGVVFRTLGDRS